jgi:ATP-dependent helicase/nuclease subunit B
MSSLDADPQTFKVWQHLLSDVAAGMALRGAHPARTVVVLPYAQLMPLATRLWARTRPDGFAPRFETTQNWSRRLRAFNPGPDDLSLEAGRDLLTAQTLLARAGLGRHRDLLAPALVEAVGHLAPLTSACPPAQRGHWLAQAQLGAMQGLEPGVLALESGVAQIALVWAATSSYASDVLFEDWVCRSVDHLVLLQGYVPDPLAQALHQHWQAHRPDSALTRLLPDAVRQPCAPPSQIALHAARDAEDEAQRAAACVLRHVAAGRTPVALAAIDRVLTRRIRAMLDAQQLAMRDENGWKLSTTRAAAHVMGALRACARQPGSDLVLDWLKNSPAQPAHQVQALEQKFRKSGQRHWPAPHSLDSQARAASADDADFFAWWLGVDALRRRLGPARSLPAWLLALRGLLHASGQWARLLADPAGLQLLQTLRLNPRLEPEVAQPQHLNAELQHWRGSDRRMGLDQFTAWVNTVLEAASYQPDYPLQEQVVILPLSQLLARPFAALVAAGCDEVRLPAAPEAPGPWTAAQRLALGLPSREQLTQASLSAWDIALRTAHCDLLWRSGDDGGETLLPSPLVRQLLLPQYTSQSGVVPQLTPDAPDPRTLRAVPAAPIQPPQPVGAALPVTQLSASAYDNLRHCPYRFFALNQLGLQEVGELDAEVDKRDFGHWLHAVLRLFHEDLRERPTDDWAERRARLDAAASATTDAMHLGAGEFLPFAATWPRVRTGYLAWLADWQAQGLQFAQAEVACKLPLGPLTLVGRLDRIDTQADGLAVVMDYKTENLNKTRQRVKIATEDTQLAFYAALLPDDSLRAAYVNVSDQKSDTDKPGTTVVELPDVLAVRDHLIHGVLHDMARIAAGAPLPALGAAPVCDYCAARGLCRKDSWA